MSVGTGLVASGFRAVAAPWEATLTDGQHSIITYALVVAGFALLAGLARAWLTRDEVGARYRTAVIARIAVMAIATVTYGILLVTFTAGYERTPAGFVPTASALDLILPRYAEWTVTVPLLVVELLAVTALAGAALRRTRYLAMSAAFAMILAGFIGGVVLYRGQDATALLIWGGISVVFWIAVNVVLVRAVRASIPVLTAESGMLLRRAAVILLTGWVIYPVVYLLPLVVGGAAWATTLQVVLSAADVIVKVGFSGVIHRIAKLRTAEDVRTGDDVHAEAIWISSVKQADAGAARAVYLAEGASVHERRHRPAEVSAVASPIHEDDR